MLGCVGWRTLATWLLLTSLPAPAQTDKSGVSPGTISLPGGPGSIEGLGEAYQAALNTGTGRHALRVKVPPGPAGHGPSIVLTYDGGSGNGVLGMGWGMEVPCVQRQTDKGVPRYVDGPNGLDDDWDGQVDEIGEVDGFINEASEELVPVKDGETTSYFCENEGMFIRYRRVGDHWEGRLPSGTRMIFGKSATARVSDPGDPERVFRWLVEQVIDTRGNTIRYRYRDFVGVENEGQKYLAAVEYGAGEPPWGGAFHFVAFTYDSRADWSEDCRAGFALRTGRRLGSMVVGTQGLALPGHANGDFNADGTGDSLNRRYELGYEPAVPRSLLVEVRQVGADGVAALPPSRYGYTQCPETDSVDAGVGLIESANAPLRVFDDAGVDLTDLNGDGLPDLLQTDLAGGAHQVAFNQGELVDTDGTVTVHWSDSENIVKAAGSGDPWQVGLAMDEAVLVDVDGDGLSDLVAMGVVDTVYYRCTPPGDGSARWGARQFLDAVETLPPSPFGSGGGVRALDLNFDKRCDIVESIPVAGGHMYRVWFNLEGDIYSRQQLVAPGKGYDFSRKAVQLADLNGDGLVDIAEITPNQVVYTANFGHGNFAEEVGLAIPDATLTQSQLEKAALRDVNGDGLADLIVVRPTPETLWVWFNRGNRTLGGRALVTGLPVSSDPNAAVRWADINGNGTVDFVAGSGVGGAADRIQAIDLGRVFGCVPRPWLLNRIANGIGRVEGISYTTSTSQALVDGGGAGTDYRYAWPYPLPFPVTVISEIRSSDSLGATYVTRYRYHDGFYDPHDKQFRGFGRVEQIDVGDAAAPTLVTRSRFDVGYANKALKGKLLRLTAEDEAGGVFHDAVTGWAVRALHNGADGRTVSFAHAESTTTDVLEQGRGTPRRTLVEFGYDNYGNQTAERNYGIVEGVDLTAGNDERVTITSYAYNLTDWLVRHPFEVEVRDAAGTVVNRSRTYYDDPGFAGDNGGVVTTGNASMVRRWVDPAVPAAFIASQRTKFDGFGNPVDLFDPLWQSGGATGHWRHISYDSVFQTFPETETIHVGGAVATLEFKARYDAGFGTVVRAEDFNDNVTGFGYDPLARLTSIVKPYDSVEAPTIEFDYQLAQPFGAAGVINWTETRQRESAGGGQFISRDFSDGLGRKRLTKHEDEEAGLYVAKGAATFNARRGLHRTSNPYQSSSFEFELPADGVPFVETRYDGLLRPLAVINQDLTEARNQYQPLVVRKFDENDNTPASKHSNTPFIEHRDGLGRLVQVDEVVRLTDQGGDTGTEAAWSTVYNYRCDDALVSFTDSQNNVKLMEYDGLGRMTYMDDPDRGGMRALYDAASNLLQSTDNKHQFTKFTYDGANRIRTEDYLDEGLPFSANHAFDPEQPISTTNRPDVAFFYDAPVGDLDVGDGTTATAANTLGKLAYVWDLSGESHSSYDSRARLDWEVKRVPDSVLADKLVSYKTTHEYDSMDRPTGLIYPDGDRITRLYNPRSLLETITGGPGGAILTSIDYKPWDALARCEYGNGVETVHGYDTRLRLKDLTIDRGANVRLLDYTYHFDAVSNLDRVDDNRSLAGQPEATQRRNTQIFGYDNLYRITNVTYPGMLEGGEDGSIGYRYDRLGNMLAKTSDIPHLEGGLSVTHLGAMSYGGTAGAWGRTGLSGGQPGCHALTAVASGNRVYPYDANGNMTVIDGLGCTWDFKDRLVRVGNAAMSASYTYDYRDQRIVKQVTPKPGQPDAGRPRTTIYVNRYFEVRDHDVPVKYVWNGETRVARVTGTLDSEALRTQRLRLVKGWNLVAVNLGGGGGQLDPASHPVLEAALKWDAASLSWLPATDGLLAAHTPCWLFANESANLTLTGTSPAAGSIPLTAGAQFVVNPGVEPLELSTALPADADLLYFDRSGSRWLARYAGPSAALSDAPATLPAGEAVFARTAEAGSLATADPALEVRYYHQDHLGSVNLVCDQSGRIVEETACYPYGHVRHSFRPQSPIEHYGFTQKERDLESGLHYFEARYLCAALGRFITVDPLSGTWTVVISNNGGLLHPYLYAEARPIQSIDPLGLAPANAPGIEQVIEDAHIESLRQAVATNDPVEIASGIRESIKHEVNRQKSAYDLFDEADRLNVPMSEIKALDNLPSNDQFSDRLTGERNAAIEKLKGFSLKWQLAAVEMKQSFGVRETSDDPAIFEKAESMFDMVDRIVIKTSIERARKSAEAEKALYRAANVVPPEGCELFPNADGTVPRSEP